MFNLNFYTKEKQRLINAELARFLDDQDSHPTLLVQAMRYCLEAGGKRLRPILCIAASEVVGGSELDAIGPALALELIHTYSLIHDDLPAMDNDDFRRGKPACHKAFDEATAILTGDALLTAAFEVLTTGAYGSINASRCLEVISLIARAAGSSGMVQGQMMDLAFEGEEITWEQLAALQNLKTGALIEASVRAGAILGGGSIEQVAALSAYGTHVGLAFQIADDILNVEGTSDELGKPVGSDEAAQKATAISVLGLKEAKIHAGRLIDCALKELRIFGKRGEPFAALARYVIERTK